MKQAESDWSFTSKVPTRAGGGTGKDMEINTRSRLCDPQAAAMELKN